MAERLQFGEEERDEFEFRRHETCRTDFHGYIYKIGTYHFNWHTEMELLTIVRGRVEVCAAGRAGVCAPGDMVLINPNQGHATLSLEPGGLALALHFDPAVFAGVVSGWPSRIFQSQPGRSIRATLARRRIRALLAAMALYGNSDPTVDFRLSRDFFDLLLSVVEAFPLSEPIAKGDSSPRSKSDVRIPARGVDNHIIARVCRYIERHFREHITLSELSRIGSYNPTYLSQIFTQAIGVSCFDYLARVRIREATRDLGETGRRICDIALDNGFADAKAFDTAFRRSFGKSPSEYRKLLPAPAEAEMYANVDSTFKERFVPRNDAGTTAVLSAWVREVFPPEGLDERLATVRRGMEQLNSQMEGLLHDLSALQT